MFLHNMSIEILRRWKRGDINKAYLCFFMDRWKRGLSNLKNNQNVVKEQVPTREQGQARDIIADKVGLDDRQIIY